MHACSTDTNAPDEALCHAFLDQAVLENGVNLVDTAEQYPIPSGLGSPEGRTEEIIGKWMSKVVTWLLLSDEDHFGIIDGGLALAIMSTLTMCCCSFRGTTAGRNS